MIAAASSFALRLNWVLFRRNDDGGGTGGTRTGPDRVVKVVLIAPRLADPRNLVVAIVSLPTASQLASVARYVPSRQNSVSIFVFQGDHRRP